MIANRRLKVNFALDSFFCVRERSLRTNKPSKCMNPVVPTVRRISLIADKHLLVETYTSFGLMQRRA